MMKDKIRTEFRPDSVDLVNFIIKHIRLLLITGFITAILAAAVSLMLKPLYESSVILYPSSNIAETPSLLGEISPEATLFGDDDATEKLLQILNSSQVTEYLKTKYDLMTHYNIRPGEKYPNTVIARMMKKYIHSAKTSFGSVEIKVRDRDREIACAMANDIAARADTILNTLQRGASAGILSDINRSYQSQLSLVKQYQDSIVSMSDQYNLRLFAALEAETDYLALIRGRYMEAQALSRQTLPYTLVVDRAIVAEKKIWPKRSYIVIITAASAVLLMALGLFVAGGMKQHRTDDQL